MSSDKKRTKKKIIGAVTTAAVIILLAAVAVYAVFGRSENTRTHFTAVSTEKRYTDMMTETSEHNEFEQFEFDLVDTGSLQFDDNFKTNYPNVTEALTDLDFCASETAVKSVDFGNGIMVMDAYSYVSDYSTRWLDILYIPYNTDETRSIIISKPYRYMVKYDSSLAAVTLESFDKENYRLNFYTLSLEAAAGDSRCDWNVTAVQEMNSTSGDVLKAAGKNLKVNDKDAKEISSEIKVYENKAETCFRMSQEQAGSFTLTLSFDDTMYDRFDSLTVSLENDDGYKSDSTSFVLTVNG